MKERLKAIRKSLSPKVSQEKFGIMFGVSRNAIKTYELGTVIPSDTFIQLLCSKLNINEEWLRTGTGEMYIKNNDSLFEEFAQRYNLSPAEQEAARYCLQLTSEQRQEVLNHIVGLADAIKSAQVIAPDFTHHSEPESNNSENGDIENDEEFQERIDILRQEYRAEKKGKTSEESTFSRKTKGKRA